MRRDVMGSAAGLVAAVLLAGCTTTVVGTASPAATAAQADAVAPVASDVRLSAVELEDRAVDGICADLPTDAFGNLDAETGVSVFDGRTESGDLSCYLWTSFGDVAVSVDLLDRRDADHDFPYADDPWVPADGLGDQGWVLIDPSRTAPEGYGPVQVAALSGDMAVWVSLYSADEGPYPDLAPVEASMREFVPEVIALLGTPGTPVGGPPAPVVEQAGTTELSPPDPADGPAWTIEGLMPALEEYADEETEDWATFTPEYVTIPCGGSAVQGMGTGLVANTSGGATIAASVEVFADAEAAYSEYLRVRDIAVACTRQHDYISSTSGNVLFSCDPLEVSEADAVTRYLSVCGAGDPRDIAIFRSGNAVITLDSLASSRVNDDLEYWLTLFDADA